MNNITEPLRLAVGNHQAGSGQGCAMNVVSWENGDTQITDMPGCSDRLLARIVQRVNDSLCRHRTGDLLCPSCSIEVLALAHRTVGTGEIALTDDERHRLWVGIAADQARAVQHLARNEQATERAIVAAEVFAKGGPKPAAASAYASASADAAASASADAAAYAAAYAAAAADASAYADADAAAYAAAAADASAYADADADAAALRLAHRAIDKFEELTGTTPRIIAPDITSAAVSKMLAHT